MVYGSEGSYVNWKAGAKYYFSSKFPVQVDVNGSIGSFLPSVMLGFQGGYAWFVANNISVEPGIRYIVGVSDNFDAFGATVAFSLFF